MARIHFWSHAFDSEGRAIQNAAVSVYFAGTTSPASVYLQERGGSPVSSPPQISTDRKGLYEFWVGDINESSGYSANQKFKISWVKDNDSDVIDNVSIIPIYPQVAHTTTSLWVTASPSGYFSDCSHYLDNDVPLVQCWNLETAEVETPTKVEVLTSDTVRVYFPTNLYRYAVTAVG
jgi:hypothetical protein